MKFMGVKISTDINQGEMMLLGGATYAQLLVAEGARPKIITLRVSREERPGIIPFSIFESRPGSMDSGTEFVLNVPVYWNNHGVPITRQKGVDNVDIIVLEPTTKYFLDIQVGLITRGGKFFITAQKIWEGWMKGKTMDDLEFIPAQSEHAYPGSDYSAIWVGMGEVMRFTWELISKTAGPLDKATPAKWTPRVPTPKTGWVGGTVAYFNMITGTGMVFEGTQKHFVHFSAIESSNPVKTLPPMAPVEFRVKDGKISYVRTQEP